MYYCNNNEFIYVSLPAVYDVSFTHQVDLIRFELIAGYISYFC